MEVPRIGDADARYLERVAEDCEQMLGPGIELRSLEVASNAEKVLRLSYRLGDVEATSDGRGRTIVAAHADLRQHLVVDRVRIGVSALYRWKPR
jgi:hypothetical protein